MKDQARWLAPATAAAVIVGGVALAQAADASEQLPARTAKQLLLDLHNAKPTALSGTVTETADLGLPELPASMTDGANSAGASSLLSGTNTIRVWSDGAKKSRIALVAESSETNLVRNGDQVWQWSSATQTATRSVLQPKQKKQPSTDVPKTPEEAADWALAKIDPTTKVSTTGTATVAGRSAYELVLTPKDASTRVASVRIAIDAEKKIPLRVRVFSTKAQTKAIEVGFTAIDFSKPANRVFAFTPPPGAKVVEPKSHSTDRKPAVKGDKPTVTGDGWSQIISGTRPAGTKPKPASESNKQSVEEIANLFPKVSGAWGSGRVLDGTLFSVVVTDDGRFAAGAVAPDALYEALPAR